MHQRIQQLAALLAATVFLIVLGLSFMPVESPRRIAFAAHPHGTNDIYVMNADGSGQINLTNHPADDYAPAWSPDGQQLVFISNRGENQDNYDIYIMNADGAQVTRLTTTPLAELAPAWSPDGVRISFVYMGAVFIMNADGSASAQLTDLPASVESPPVWHP